MNTRRSERPTMALPIQYSSSLFPRLHPNGTEVDSPANTSSLDRRTADADSTTRRLKARFDVVDSFFKMHLLESWPAITHDVNALVDLWNRIPRVRAKKLSHGSTLEPTGRVKQKHAPPSLRDSAQRRPLCDSTIERHIASPIPIPLGLVV